MAQAGPDRRARPRLLENWAAPGSLQQPHGSRGQSSMRRDGGKARRRNGLCKEALLGPAGTVRSGEGGRQATSCRTALRREVLPPPPPPRRQQRGLAAPLSRWAGFPRELRARRQRAPSPGERWSRPSPRARGAPATDRVQRSSGRSACCPEVRGHGQGRARVRGGTGNTRVSRSPRTLSRAQRVLHTVSAGEGDSQAEQSPHY